ncbi:putative metal-dependent phosphohydrolase protein [Rhizobium phage RHph_I1_18]|nr:putative metal-dependent phosphohydrolase protein [Rhizobium phage RHph_I1_18]
MTLDTNVWMCNTKISNARWYADKAHQKLGQKYGGLEYVAHLDEVFVKAIEYLHHIPEEHRIDTLMLAFLHDIIEDTEETIHSIKFYFGERLSFLVDCISDAEGANRKERKRKTWHKLRKSDLVIFIKLCDRLCNTPGKLRDMYRKEFPSFEAALYVPGQFEDMWDELRKVTFES